MVSTGEALPQELAKQLLPKGKELWNLYGPTEITIWATSYHVKSGDEPILIGRPLDNTQIYILDPGQKLVPVGVPGELHIAGAGVARGYLNRPELTENRFIWNEALKTRLYKTGDLVRYLSDGNIECLGRIDTQVKVRGFRIELGEIESVLNSHAEINQAVVVTTEDGSGDKRLIAYVVRSAKAIANSEIRQFLQRRLPEYMLPSAFVDLEQLPITPNGKVDRLALRKLKVEFVREDEYIAPRNAHEVILANTFADVLSLEQVGIRDNFFELGGHSLLATQLISRIREIKSIELPLRILFEFPTVAELALAIERQKDTTDVTPELPEISRLARRKRQIKRPLL